ncbi:hypothetical protein D3C86_2195750 [compost metagenome]
MFSIKVNFDLLSIAKPSIFFTTVRVALHRSYETLLRVSVRKPMHWLIDVKPVNTEARDFRNGTSLLA